MPPPLRDKIGPKRKATTKAKEPEPHEHTALRETRPGSQAHKAHKKGEEGNKSQGHHVRGTRHGTRMTGKNEQTNAGKNGTEREHKDNTDTPKQTTGRNEQHPCSIARLGRLSTSRPWHEARYAYGWRGTARHCQSMGEWGL